MLFVSNRNKFWGPSGYGDLAWAEVKDLKSAASIKEGHPALDELYSQLFDKKLLILIHGYNSGQEPTLKRYFDIYKKIQETDDSLYDCIIGYMWPGHENRFHFLAARDEASKCAPCLRKFLRDVSVRAKHVDVLAHSMGNLVLFEALNYLPLAEPKYQSPFSKKFSNLKYLSPVSAKSLIRTVYSVAPAVDDKSLDSENEYYNPPGQSANLPCYYEATFHMGELCIFFSEKDTAFDLYPLADWIPRLKRKTRDNIPSPTEQEEDVVVLNNPEAKPKGAALGRAAGATCAYLPMNVQTIDCSKLDYGHSTFFEKKLLYNFIKEKTQNMLFPKAFTNVIRDDLSAFVKADLKCGRFSKPSADDIEVFIKSQLDEDGLSVPFPGTSGWIASDRMVLDGDGGLTIHFLNGGKKTLPNFGK